MATWRKIHPDAKDADRPRHLTKEEIKTIVDKIPAPLGVSRYAVDIAHEEIKYNLALKLRKIEISSSAIEKLANTIYTMYDKAHATPGDPVAYQVAQAFGNNITQFTLNTFHSQGSDLSAREIISSVKETTNASKERKFPFTVAYFKNKYLSYYDALVMQSIFVSTVASDFIKNKGSIIKHYKSNNIQVKNEFINSITDRYIPVEDVRIETSVPFYLELQIDEVQLYRYQLSVRVIAEKIYKQLGYIKKGNNEKKCLTVYYGSALDPKIYIFASHETLYDEFEHIVDVVVNPGLNILRISGYDDVTGYSLIQKPLHSVILEEEHLTATTTAIKLSGYDMYQHGITKEHIVKYFTVLGLVDTDDPFLPKDDEDPENKYFWNKLGYKNIDPSKYPLVNDGNDFHPGYNQPNIDRYPVIVVNSKDRKKGGSVASWIGEQFSTSDDNSKKNYYTEYEDIGRYGAIRYAKLGGNNFVKVMRSSHIDKTLSYCNNMHIMAKYVGMGAGKSTQTSDVTSTMDQAGVYIHPTNTMLFVDFQFGKTHPIGVSTSGIAADNKGFLTISSIEKVINTFKNAAIGEVPESSNNVIASLILGTDIKMGTGYAKPYFEKNGTLFIDKDVMNAGKISADEGKIFLDIPIDPSLLDKIITMGKSITVRRRTPIASVDRESSIAKHYIDLHTDKTIVRNEDIRNIMKVNTVYIPNSYVEFHPTNRYTRVIEITPTVDITSVDEDSDVVSMLKD